MPWEALRSGNPDLAGEAARLLSESHGYAFLATTTADGAPRVHPVSPVVTPTAVYLALTSTSPKVRDLRRDPRFALHSSVLAPEDEEISVRGTVTELGGGDRDRVRDERICGAELGDSMVLFGLNPEHVRWSTWTDGKPERSSWRAP